MSYTFGDTPARLPSQRGYLTVTAGPSEKLSRKSFDVSEHGKSTVALHEQMMIECVASRGDLSEYGKLAVMPMTPARHLGSNPHLSHS
jgi:hypothetical protein